MTRNSILGKSVGIFSNLTWLWACVRASYYDTCMVRVRVCVYDTNS